jgi:ABC-2 type transport system permease protein
MKILDIALMNMTRSFRSLFAVVFMFVIPILVTGMFYFMFGNMAQNGGEFNLPRTKVIVANLDEGGPKFSTKTKNIPGGENADTMGELIVGILQNDDLADLVEVALAADAASARAAVDDQTAEVALIIPKDFSHQFADLDGKAVIEFYQDPTLTIGPNILRSILERFTEGMAGVKIAVNVFMDEAAPEEQVYAGEFVQRYLNISLAEADDIESELLDVRAPASGTKDASAESHNLLLTLISPIMGGMMVFYAFFTGTFTAESMIKEEEEHTLPRLFTTPTSQAAILGGKYLSVFLTVIVQVIVLLIASKLIFGIHWGSFQSIALSVFGIVVSASSFGIFINSFVKNIKQGGIIYGGVHVVTGMIGMISVFTMSAPNSADIETVSLFVPQGWAIRGLMQSMGGEAVTGALVTALVLLIWSAAFFVIGVMRFNKRYA